MPNFSASRTKRIFSYNSGDTHLIYFDNSATTQPLPEVVAYITENLSDPEGFGNTGSLHRLGTLAGKQRDQALERISKALDCSPKELVFTSGGTESINTAIRGYLSANPRAGNRIISTRTEHKASLKVLESLEKSGYQVEYLPVDLLGQPDLEALDSMLRTRTALLTLTHVNNETGAILPIKDIVQLRNRISPETRIHLDCVQSLGKLPMNLHRMGVDMASFSGHKIHCVKGIGGLFLRSGCRIDPLLLGGGQQNGLRSGTECPWLYQALAIAVEESGRRCEKAYSNAVLLRNTLLKGLGHRPLTVNSPPDGSPFIVNLSFSGFQAQTMLQALEAHGVFVSTVSACASRKQEISYVLQEMGVARDVAARALRVSFSSFSLVEEVVSFCEIVENIYREFSLERG